MLGSTWSEAFQRGGQVTRAEEGSLDVATVHRASNVPQVFSALRVLGRHTVMKSALERVGCSSDSPIDRQLDCFDLFDGCEPIDLLIENLSENAAEIGLTEERIQTLAESRLRAAGDRPPMDGRRLRWRLVVPGGDSDGRAAVSRGLRGRFLRVPDAPPSDIGPYGGSGTPGLSRSRTSRRRVRVEVGRRSIRQLRRRDLERVLESRSTG